MTVSVTEQLRRKLGGDWKLDRRFACWRCNDMRIVYRVYGKSFCLLDDEGNEVPIEITGPRPAMYTKGEVVELMKASGLRK